MSFSWPLALLALVMVPLLLAAYLLSLRRQRQTVSYSSVALIRAARPPRSTWRRHLPVALLLGALSCLGLAAARPQVQVDIPVAASSVILALDVSGSMCATDVDPNRLGAAQAAVREFIKDQDKDTRIGLVAFAGFAQLVVEPSNNRDELLQAVNSLTTGRGTAIGAALLASIDAIAGIDPDVAPAQAGAGQDGTPPGPSPQAQPVPGPSSPGQPPASDRRFAPEIVVLLTDGANTHGVTPVDAAQVAAQRGVRVYPIGFGTTNPTSMSCTAEQLGGNGFENFSARGALGSGGFGGGVGNRLLVDEQTLKEVASITGGTYFAAQGADQLQQVFDDLPRNVKLQQRDVELSAGLAIVAALLVLLCAGAAIRWSTFPN